LDGALPQVLDPQSLPVNLSAELTAAVNTALASDRAQVITANGIESLVAACNPPLRMVIVGAVHISESLCRMAVELGYRVTVIDPRAGFARQSLFPGVELINEWPQQAFAAVQVDARTAVVLLTHDPKIDDPALECVLSSPVFYIGALGSTRTHARRLQRLAERGWSDTQLARINGPAGLAIGARTPAEIALSVLAQATQCLRRSGP
jgi:xanthine dehydrogenase accessory factor